jgi:integrase/recombinase XerC
MKKAAPSAQTLAPDQRILSFLDYLKYEKRFSPHTILAYHTDLRDFYEFVDGQFGVSPPVEIKQVMVRSWLAALKEQDISSRSIRRKISSLKTYFKHLVKMGKLKSTPMSGLATPKLSKRLPVFIKEEETANLVETLSTVTEDWKTLNAKMLIVMFYNTGMRLSELINLRDSQIDFSRKQLKVLGKGNKERIIPISKELIRAIREYQQSRKKEFERTDDTLLVTEKGKKIYPKYAYLLVNQMLGAAGTLDRKSPHVLRHTFATHLMNGGASLNAVKELLGHASLASTEVYTHNSIEKLKNVYKKAHPKA